MDSSAFKILWSFGKDIKMREVEVFVSSVTGNTKKLSDALIPCLQSMGYTPRVTDTSQALHTSQTPDTTQSPDEEKNTDADKPVILCFWCRKAGLDDLSLRLVRNLSGRKIAAFGTMGSYPDSPYGNQVRENVSRAICEKNHLLGLYLCRGKIDEKRTSKRRSLPTDHPHYLNDEAYKRHLSSRTHPDEEDLEQAVEFIKRSLSYEDISNQ